MSGDPRICCSPTAINSSIVALGKVSAVGESLDPVETLGSFHAVRAVRVQRAGKPAWLVRYTANVPSQ